jgi:predicted CoA-substrate-specific enzyme activase
LADSNYFVGIDVGSTVCKAVAINSSEKEIAAEFITPVMGGPEKAAILCLKDLSKKLNVKIKQLKKSSIATGLNGEKISIKEKESEITCIGKGAYTLNPSIQIVVDVGSFSMKALKLDDTGKIADFMMNYRCAAGGGILLELVGEGLELDITELSDIASQSKNPIPISSQCSIFAESEVISYKNEGSNLADLVAGVCNSVAGRVYPLVIMLDKKPQFVAFTGGVAKNKWIVKNLEERLELELVKLPIDPEYIGAYGAAIIAKERGGV